MKKHVTLPGRDAELAELSSIFEKVKAGSRAGRPGKAVLVRGRRRVGKSRLVEEFVEDADVPYLYFTASAQLSLEADLQLFTKALAASSLPGAFSAVQQAPQNWDAAMSLLVAAIPSDQPSIVVLDEMPYLLTNDQGFEGTLQKFFDRELARRPVLLLCIGSDLAMMEALNEYGRPFHQRATEMVVHPLSPATVGDMLELRAAEAFDAYLITGGLPLILEEWPTGASREQYLAAAVKRPTSALLVSAERALAAEFPSEALARHVLSAIGSGERTFSLIARAAGGIPATSLRRSLEFLVAKRVVTAIKPLSTRASKETRYVVVDPYLKFWLAFLEPAMGEIERGRGDVPLSRIATSWTTWRGRTIEPIIREALRRLPEQLPEGTHAVGSYWTRVNDPEIDIVGTDREPVARRITVVGSIKWLEHRPFTSQDLGDLVQHRSQLPGADTDTALMAVCRQRGGNSDIPMLGADDLLAAW